MMPPDSRIWSERYKQYIDPRPVPDFSNYLATYDGRIWSTLSRQYLEPAYNVKGYLRVTLYKKGSPKGKRLFVHRIVGIVFHENPQGKKIVDHLDEYIFNNHGDNLEWATHSENVKRSKMLRTERDKDGVPF